MVANAYDPEEVRAIANTLNQALRAIETRLKRRLSGDERARYTDRIIDDLLDAFDAGERTSEELERVARAAIAAAGAAATG